MGFAVIGAAFDWRNSSGVAGAAWHILCNTPHPNTADRGQLTSTDQALGPQPPAAGAAGGQPVGRRGAAAVARGPAERLAAGVSAGGMSATSAAAAADADNPGPAQSPGWPDGLTL